MKTKACLVSFIICSITISIFADKGSGSSLEESDFFSAIQDRDLTAILDAFKKNQEAFSWYKKELVTLIEEEDSHDFGDELLDYIDSNYKNKDPLSKDTLEVLGISMRKRLRSFLKEKLHDSEEITEIIRNLGMVYRFHLKTSNL